MDVGCEGGRSAGWFLGVGVDWKVELCTEKGEGDLDNEEEGLGHGESERLQQWLGICLASALPLPLRSRRKGVRGGSAAIGV